MRRPCLWEGALMSGEVWMGYLVDHNDAFTVVQSPFVLNGERVFGADSDATTLAIAGVLHRLQHDELPSLSLPDGIDGEAYVRLGPERWRARRAEGSPEIAPGDAFHVVELQGLTLVGEALGDREAGGPGEVGIRQTPGGP